MADTLEHLEGDLEPAAARPAGSSDAQHPRAGTRAERAAADSARKTDHKTAIIVIVSVIGVAIAWLTYRRTGSTSGTSSTTTPTLGTGTLAGSGTPDPNAAIAAGPTPDPYGQDALLAAMNQFGAELGTLNANVVKLGAARTAGTPTSAHHPAPAPHPHPAPRPPAHHTVAPHAAARPAAPPHHTAPAAQGGGYTIRPGDTLSGIAARFRTSVAALLRLNPSIRNPNMIYAGGHLNIGSGAAAAAPSRPATRPAAHAAARVAPRTAARPATLAPGLVGIGAVPRSSGSLPYTLPTSNNPTHRGVIGRQTSYAV